MAAVVSIRSRHLLKAYKAIPTGAKEVKFYYATPDERIRVLREVADADVDIVYVCIDKENAYNPPIYGNELYCVTLKELIRSAFAVSLSKDVDIMLDENHFIKADDLRTITNNISVELGINIKRCSKVSSNRCVRIADYTVGSIWAKYERGNEEFFEIISKKISLAREP